VSLSAPISLTINGRTLTLQNWALAKNVSYKTLYHRLAAGWSHEEVVGDVVRTKLRREFLRSNQLTCFNGLEVKKKFVVVTDNEETGAEAKRIRRLAGKTIYEAAADIGISGSHLSDLEKGKTSHWKDKIVQKFNDAAAKWVLKNDDDGIVTGGGVGVEGGNAAAGCAAVGGDGI